MGSREKGPDSGNHNVAKVATAISVTGLVAAGVAVVVAKRKKGPKEVHASQKDWVRYLHTYDPDEQGRTPEEIAAVLKDSLLEDEDGVLPEVAVLIHFASTSMARSTTFTRLREQIDGTVKDEAIQTAIAYLETNGLIAPPPEHDEADSQPAKYSSTRALAWAMDQSSEDFRALADAANRVLLNRLGNAEEF